jgi:hypothetical protein
MFERVKQKKFSNTAKYRQFGVSERGELFPGKPLTPGPGEYLVPSLFGHYISKTAELSATEQNTLDMLNTSRSNDWRS